MNEKIREYVNEDKTLAQLNYRILDEVKECGLSLLAMLSVLTSF